jgi:hypothetical protein
MSNNRVSISSSRVFPPGSTIVMKNSGKYNTILDFNFFVQRAQRARTLSSFFRILLRHIRPVYSSAKAVVQFLDGNLVQEFLPLIEQAVCVDHPNPFHLFFYGRKQEKVTGSQTW